MEKTKKEYHAACKSFQTAKVQCANSQNDPAISADQKKKFEDKVEKHKKEVEITKSKYKQALEDLNSYNSHYIEDMNNVYKKCDSFEKDRLEFFIQRFVKLHGHLNIYEKMNIEEVSFEKNFLSILLALFQIILMHKLIWNDKINFFAWKFSIRKLSL